MRRAVTICCLLSAVFMTAPSAWAKAPNQPADPPQVTKLRVAHIVLTGGYPEGAQAPGLFGNVVESLAGGLSRLNKAADDRRISAVVLRVKGPAIGWAKLYEFRQAIKRLRAKDKKVYAWLDSAATMDYLIAAGCDEVIMPESGVLMMTGLRAEVSFYKNLFDKLDIKAEMLRVGEFKSAAEPYTRTEMSPEFRKEMEEILDDTFRQLVETVVEGRKLDKKQVIAAIDSGPHTARAAKKLGLIDHIAYEDEIPRIIKGQDKNVEVTFARKYAKQKLDTDFSGFAGMMKLMNLMMGVQPSARRSRNSKIAVIYASGAIMSGKSTQSLLGGSVLGSETIIKAVRKANGDDTVKAIVLRVDSPGGSALASDLMWRALEKVDKPLVVSMGDVAASGGYYISMGADYIYAEPGTITGSIGVVGGKFALQGLYEKVGISTTVISRGKNSGVMSTTTGFTESERKAMTKMLYEVYDQFTKKAAKGRGMKQADLEKLARGRIYTGAMAVKNGLVDKLGTLDDAVEHATRLAGLDPGDKIERLLLPKPASPFEALFGPLGADAKLGQARSSALLESVRLLSPEIAEHLKAASIVNLLAREQRLTLMPFRLYVK